MDFGAGRLTGTRLVRLEWRIKMENSNVATKH